MIFKKYDVFPSKKSTGCVVIFFYYKRNNITNRTNDRYMRYQKVNLPKVVLLYDTHLLSIVDFFASTIGVQPMSKMRQI